MSMNKDTNQNMTQINAYSMDGLGNNFVIIDRRMHALKLNKQTYNKIVFKIEKK